MAIVVGFMPVHLIAKENQKQAEVISSLQWGEVLFYYFKGDKMNALIRLYARESRNQFQTNQTQADLLAAGLLLDLGLASKAQSRLEKIGNEQLDVTMKSRLSLVMARVYFHGQNFELAQQWLDTVDETHLNESETARKKLMEAQLLFSFGKYSLAAKQLESIQSKGNLQYYALYNNGLSLLNVNDTIAQKQGRQLLQKVRSIEPIDQEQYALIDQATLALGLDALNSGYTTDAREYFKTIRLDGLVSNDALLLLGWAFAETQHFEEALTYWNRLSAKETLLEPAVQEAWLAVPYAHQQLGDLNLATQGYERAVEYQLQAQAQLTMMVKEKSWKHLLAKENNATTLSFPEGIARQLIANPNFYNLLTKWQQLQELQLTLKNNLISLPTIALAIKENEARYIKKSAYVKEKITQNNYDKFFEDYKRLLKQFNVQKEKAIAEDILSTEDYQHWSKLQSVQGIIDNIPSEISDTKISSFRLVDGVAKWKFHRQRDTNVWTTERALKGLSESLEQLTKQLQRLKLLVNKSGESSSKDIHRVEELVKRGTRISQHMSELQNEIEQAMSEEFRKFVSKRQAALDNLAEQANLALARLRFRAIQESFTNE